MRGKRKVGIFLSWSIIKYFIKCERFKQKIREHFLREVGCDRVRLWKLGLDLKLVEFGFEIRSVFEKLRMNKS